MTPVRRRQRPQAPRGTAGLSLIEIMIALAIGSLLILGLVQVFAASRTAYQLSEGMARTQENARFAMDYLQRDIRMAGHYGCVNDQSHLQTPGALVSHFTPAATAATWGIDFPVATRGDRGIARHAG
jgi:type IV pilus assembly protein PilW